MQAFILFLFAVAAGITASGLIANIYRLLASEPTTKAGTALLYAVMVVAGPVVLFANSTKSYRKKECSKIAYALAVALSGYWSFAMGALILTVLAA